MEKLLMICLILFSTRQLKTFEKLTTFFINIYDGNEHSY